MFYQINMPPSAHVWYSINTVAMKACFIPWNLLKLSIQRRQYFTLSGCSRSMLSHPHRVCSIQPRWFCSCSVDGFLEVETLFGCFQHMNHLNRCGTSRLERSGNAWNTRPRRTTSWWRRPFSALCSPGFTAFSLEIYTFIGSCIFQGHQDDCHGQRGRPDFCLRLQVEFEKAHSKGMSLNILQLASPYVATSWRKKDSFKATPAWSPPAWPAGDEVTFNLSSLVILNVFTQISEPKNDG